MKPWQYWLIFLGSFGVLLLAMGWISIMALSLDRGQAHAAQQAAFEENVRLALWRMENALSPMLARESARPYFVYASFYPVERAYTKTFDEIDQPEILLPSPLLKESVPNVILHFQIDPDGRISSPKSPPGKGRARSISAFDNGALIERSTERMGDFEARIDRKRFLTEVLGRAPPIQNGGGANAVLSPSPEVAQQTANNAAPETQIDQLVANVSEQAPSVREQEPQQQAAQQLILPQSAAVSKETVKNASEWNSRAMQQFRALNQAQEVLNDTVNAPVPTEAPEAATAQVAKPSAAKGGMAKQQLETRAETKAGGAVVAGAAPVQRGSVQAKSAPAPDRPKAAPAVTAIEGDMKPLWIGDMLLLARRVTVNGRDFVQGCWLDWNEIRKGLLQQVHDLLPAADLVPAAGVVPDLAGRMLAGLPVRLVPGEPAPVPWSGMRPVRFALVIAWTCVLLAAGAVGVLLAGVVSLSERRASFVSAVTHELRTPLTTFRMYAEMLSEGMVPDEKRRKEYLATLCAEGSRLSHLVENVLAYARIERGRARGHIEETVAEDIINRLRDRLAQRADQAGMSLVVNEGGETQERLIRTDVSAVEQILFNLVDNACKYAAGADDKRIHLETGLENGRLCIRVRDHGVGISAEDARRLFTPFRKSAKHAAETAPGVGLGLALSRRLARQIKGDLRICPRVCDGACFELFLPFAG